MFFQHGLNMFKHTARELFHKFGLRPLHVKLSVTISFNEMPMFKKRVAILVDISSSRLKTPTIPRLVGIKSTKLHGDTINRS